MPSYSGRSKLSAGFALLSVLLIVALVMVAVAGLLSVAATSASLIHSDEAGSRALAVADQGVVRGIEAIRWGWTIGEDPVMGQAAGGGEYSVVSTAIAPSSPLWSSATCQDAVVPASTLRVYDLAVTGSWRQGRRTIHAVVAVTPDALPRGLVVGADVAISAPLELVGCGLYAGGDVAGRQHIELSPPSVPDAPGGDGLPDNAYGGIYGSAGVHACGSIFTDAGEVHDPGVIGFASDDDRHSAGGPPREIVTPLEAPELTVLWSHARDPGPAWAAGRLLVDVLPSQPQSTDAPTDPANGLIIMVDARATTSPAIISGDRSCAAGACPLTVVVLGDCQLGAGSSIGGQTMYEGALVVTGRLTVVGTSVIRGSVFAGTLDCRASLAVDASGLAGTPRQESAPGSSNVAVITWND